MDDDFEAGPAAAEEDLSLPKATVTKLINEMLPEDINCAKEARDLIAECCVGFESYIPEVQEAYDEHSKATKDRVKGAQKKESQHTPEELEEMQAALFAKARARLNSVSAAGGGGGDGGGAAGEGAGGASTSGGDVGASSD
ncbi:negative cofactor 2 transcription regulator complex subunit ncb2 [Geranomyces variabilis]|uniref:Negative cofactor 2 transcription regulator complex subunit ncb2 n=1 Tax=Geranomyces variabilis TaxID=109894 RepID=A0AAD5TQA6_9FUNG|nr:negative cofactor 2 transcription regulator complex subunit ncb2 [Geranomyces variabilis]